jgi:hypothetical protein
MCRLILPARAPHVDARKVHVARRYGLVVPRIVPRDYAQGCLIVTERRGNSLRAARRAADRISVSTRTPARNTHHQCTFRTPQSRSPSPAPSLPIVRTAMAISWWTGGYDRKHYRERVVFHWSDYHYQIIEFRAEPVSAEQSWLRYFSGTADRRRCI